MVYYTGMKTFAISVVPDCVRINLPGEKHTG